MALQTMAQPMIGNADLLTKEAVQYEKVEWEIDITDAIYKNPYLQEEIALNLILTSPLGEEVFLPCYFENGDQALSLWKARFAPRESGNYTYSFQLLQNNVVVATSAESTLSVTASAANGFISSNNNWSFQFDSGKPFRGVGENVGWEAREWEDDEYTYDYFLPKLANNGANFIRLWMHAWNLPLEWKKVTSTERYTDSDAHFNPGAIERMDELIQLCDSLEMYLMIALDAHGGFISTGEWPLNNYNSVNGGPVDTPAEFFTSPEAKAMYKNRLRYLVARWGYSTSIAVWEFFNEIDNAMYNGETAIIPHAAVTQWHTEMSSYLKNIDPYGHLTSTSISHRQIAGLYEVPDLDFNQIHIYRNTGSIPSKVKENASKPMVVGEFAYEWDWDLVGHGMGEELDFDLKRGLWYGLFNPTPILPLTWWWELFDERGMHEYFEPVREISERMLRDGDGEFTPLTVSSTNSDLELYAVKSGENYYAYLLNNSNSGMSGEEILIDGISLSDLTIYSFDPEAMEYNSLGDFTTSENELVMENISMEAQESRILIMMAEGMELSDQLPYNNDPFSIPGVLEAEDFDTGGEGFAYHDLEAANTGGAYRVDEGVDISTDGDDPYVTGVIQGEWLEYTVMVEAAGTYQLDIQAQSGQSMKNVLQVLLGNDNISGQVNLEGIGSWETLSFTTPLLKAGAQTLRVNCTSGGFDLNNFEFTLQNEAAVVTLTEPEDGQVITLPHTLEIQVTASDADGTVEKVAFYAGDNLLGEVTEVPYAWTWDPLPGNYELYAHATDDQGLVAISDPVNIQVVPSQTQEPFEGTPYAIPGTIEAENFDLGASGVAYSDNTPNNTFGGYRTATDVDIEPSTDEGGGFNLADIQEGEWVEYTINVAETRAYNIEFRVATQESAQSFHVEIDGEDITGNIAVPNTGGWQSWETIGSKGFLLEEGEQVIRLAFHSQYFNLNRFTIKNYEGAVLGIGDTSSSNIRLFPNPSSEHFSLTIPAEWEEVVLFDTRGNQVLSISTGSNTKELGKNLPVGIYFIHVQLSDGSYGVRKFIKSI